MFERLNSFDVVGPTNIEEKGFAYRLRSTTGQEGPYLVIGEDNSRYGIKLADGETQYRVYSLNNIASNHPMQLYTEPLIEVDPTSGYGVELSPVAGDLRLSGGVASIAGFDYVRRHYDERELEYFILWSTGVSHAVARWYKRWRLIDATTAEDKNPKVLWTVDNSGVR